MPVIVIIFTLTFLSLTVSERNFCQSGLPKPLTVELSDVRLLIYTKTRNTDYTVHSLNNVPTEVAQWEKSGYFSRGRQVVFIIHGYTQSKAGAPWMSTMKDAILRATDSTVCLVSWPIGADLVNYAQASSNTQTVAKVVTAVAQAIRKSKTFAADPNKLYIHCIGHSLGAHVCGQAGRATKNFKRVTGLDPAGPGFSCSSWSHLHLNKRSATCVDTIHCEGGGASTPLDPAPFYGTLSPWSHVDFYPNAGVSPQPGCHDHSVNMPHCSHFRSVDYMIHSISHSSHFSSRGPCTNANLLPASCSNRKTQKMGYYSSCHKGTAKPIEGVFYTTTDHSIPKYWLPMNGQLNIPQKITIPPILPIAPKLPILQKITMPKLPFLSG